MNEQAVKDLYNIFIDVGYNGSEEQFKVLLETNPDALNDGFNVFKEAGYNGTSDDFAVLMGVTPTADTSPQEANPSPPSAPTPPKKKDDMASPLEDGSSEFVDVASADNVMRPEDIVSDNYKYTSEGVKIPKDMTYDEYIKFATTPTPDEYKSTTTATEKFLKTAPYQDEIVDVPGASSVMRPEDAPVIKEEGALIQRTLEEDKVSDQEALSKFKQNEDIILSEEFQADLANITDEVIDYNEDEAVDFLTDKYGKYGFVFRKIGLGNNVIPEDVSSLTRNSIEVISTDNGATEVIDLKPLAAGTTKKIITRDAVNKLKSFITTNAAPVDSPPEITDDISNAIKIGRMRKNYMVSDDGNLENINLVSAEVDGKNVVYPTLFPQNPDSDYGTDPSEWMMLDADEAFAEAKKRGEVLYVDSKEKADELAEGSWKDVSAVDVEANMFYKDRGLDYNAYKDMYNRYEDLMSTIIAIENSPTYEFQQDYSTEGLSFEEQQEKKDEMGFLYINGKKRADSEEALKELKDEAAILRESVNQDEFQRVREDFDKYLQDSWEVNGALAIEENLVIKEELDAMDDLAMKSYGLTAGELQSIVPKSPREAEGLEEFNVKYKLLENQKQQAADRYNISKTWLDAKVDKSVRDEWVEDLESVKNSYIRGFARGNAGAVILAISLGIKDIDEDSTREEAAAAIAKHMKEADTGKQGRGIYRYHKGARSFEEKLDAFYDNPLEVGASMAAESLTQLLPYGLYIIPASGLVGATTGAVYGGATTGGVGVIPGGVGGFLKGVQGGYAATIVALEYTISVLEAASNKGYDLTDPFQAEQALQDNDIWEEGKDVGLKRGLTIGAVSYLQMSLAGRIFKTGALASTSTKLAVLGAEQLTVNPLFEGGGEFLAQEVAGQRTDPNAIIDEMVGGFFGGVVNPMTMSTGAFNIYMDQRSSTNLNIAKKMTNISELAKMNYSEERITNWATKMQTLGQITSEQNQKIQKNLGVSFDSAQM